MATGTAIALGIIALLIPVCLFLLWRVWQARRMEYLREAESVAIDRDLEAVKAGILASTSTLGPEEIVSEWDANRSR